MPCATVPDVANASDGLALYDTYIGHVLSDERSQALQQSRANLHRRLMGSEFLRTLEQQILIRRQLDRLRALQPGWNSYGAEPPNDRAFELANQVLAAAGKLRMDVTRLVPSADGGIGVCFVSGGRYAHIEASNDGELTSVMFESQRPAEVNEIETERALRKALDRIRDYIGI